MESSYLRETLSFLRCEACPCESREQESVRKQESEVCSQTEIRIPAFARMTYTLGYSYY
jgi:hypothetical protein